MAPATDSRSRSALPPTCGPPSVLFINSAIWQYVASPSAWPWPPSALPAGRRPATRSSPQPRTTADRAPASTEVPWVLRVTKGQSKETWVNREEWLRSDDTDARKEACRCVGRSDRSAPRRVTDPTPGRASRMRSTTQARTSRSSESLREETASTLELARNSSSASASSSQGGTNVTGFQNEDLESGAGVG